MNRSRATLQICVAVMGLMISCMAMGCSSRQETQSSDADKKAASPPGYRLKYKSWSGTSYGAGFVHTSLSFVELDLPKGRIRRIRKSANRPMPMLPHDDAGIAKLLAQVPWTKLTKEQASAFRESISAWLETKPPSEYNIKMQLGREDGYLASLAVTWGTNTVTTTVNPRGGYSKDNPPEEWKALRNVLDEEYLLRGFKPLPQPEFQGLNVQ
ncbi:MAG: hypothetical protein GY794_02525 [bacterium]|nr:hypothetical protein [bacterium]